MNKPSIHSGHIEIAVAELLDFRLYTIVPNVSWGLGLNHECDLLALDKKNRFTEIEIKISKSDLKADFNKEHGHRSKYITRLVYAVPQELLLVALELVPKECGIITVTYSPYRKKHIAQWHRLAKHRAISEPIPDSIISKFYQLGGMRIWSLKRKLIYK
jgi:hypothetical protein